MHTSFFKIKIDRYSVLYRTAFRLSNRYYHAAAEFSRTQRILDGVRKSDKAETQTFEAGRRHYAWDSRRGSDHSLVAWIFRVSCNQLFHSLCSGFGTDFTCSAFRAARYSERVAGNPLKEETLDV